MKLRDYPIFGITILGSSFSWMDFPYYFFGSGIGWLWLRWINK